MDYYLENLNLGMNEKNTAYFTTLSKQQESNMNADDEDVDKNVNTFKMFSSFLEEKDGLLAIMKEICDYCLKPSGSQNKTVISHPTLFDSKNRVIMILSKYQEQPGLLDPIFPLFIPDIMNTSLKLIDIYLKEANKDIYDYILCLYQIIYISCKIRGFSTISKFFSSEVAIFESVINFLLIQPYDNQESWFLNYVLVLWTTILAMVPFDIDTIDSKGSLITKLINYFKEELVASTNLRNITSYALSKFLIRPDLIKKGYLDSFIEYAISKILDDKTDVDIFTILGMELSLCEIYKNGQPKDLSKYIDTIIKTILPFKFQDYIQSSGLFRKCLCKLIQRVGLILLKPKFQKWRYHLEVKNLLASSIKPTIEEKKQEEEMDYKDELDYEIDFSALETIIDFLLSSLSDKEYIVRWSAAKGLGRICERLTKAMVEDIFQSIFDLFKDEEMEFAWHGACLCIAELCKRGMILPERLGDFIPLLEKALIYEISKGTFCTGSSVRDSACYIVWAIARAYTTDIMKKYIEKLSSTLILTILFDKEVNCRRAASAAFQEHVGRQGYFPNGIEIITEADYFTLAHRANCYLNVSVFIAQYPNYLNSIINYLAFNRLIHVDKQIRGLASEALALIVPFTPDYFIQDILPKLIETCHSPNIFVRHGSLIGIGYILLGLSGKWDYFNKAKIIRKKKLEGLNENEKKVLIDSEYRKKFEQVYDSIKTINHLNKIINTPLNKSINEIIQILDKNNLYRSKGSEIMRFGANTFLQLISIINLPIESTDYLFYHSILIDNIVYNKANVVQTEAINSLQLLNDSYGEKFSNEESVYTSLDKTFKTMLNRTITDSNLDISKGFISSIVLFNSKYILANYDELLKNLIKNTKMTNDSRANDAETRKVAIESLGYLTCKYMMIKESDLDEKILVILNGFNDYELDKKYGDVGSKIREASIKSITDVMLALYKNNKKDKFNQYIVQALSELIKQLAEKTARIRQCAGNCIQKFFYEMRENDIELSKVIPQYDELKTIFLTDIDFDDNGEVNNINWLTPEYSYKAIIPLLLLESYQKKFFEGLLYSIGCITEDVQRFSLESLKQMLQSKDEASKKKLIRQLLTIVLDVFKEHAKDDKVIEPLFSSLNYLFSTNVFINNEFIDLIDQIHKCIGIEIHQSKNIHKVLYSVEIYYNLLFYEKEVKYNILFRCLRSLLVVMAHRYPAVRKKASEKFFIFLSGLDDPLLLNIDETQMEEITMLLADTDWTENVDAIKGHRNSIAAILKITI